MPDSDWSLVEGDESRDYDAAHGRGQPPGPDFSEQGRNAKIEDGDEFTLTTTETIWEDLEAVPPGQPVSEYCSRCPDHVHTVTGDVPDADQQHVNYLRWGDHRGVRYRNATIRGTEIKREEFVFRFKPKPPPAGPGFGLGLQWQLNREHRIAFWYSRTIDRVVDGVIWQPLDTRPCTDRGEYYVSLDQVADRLASAIGLKMTDEGPAPTIVGNEFLGLFRSAARLKHPTFSVSADSHAGSGGWPNQWIVTLEDLDKPGHPVKRIRTKTEDGRLRYVGDV